VTLYSDIQLVENDHVTLYSDIQLDEYDHLEIFDWTLDSKVVFVTEA